MGRSKGTVFERSLVEILRKQDHRIRDFIIVLDTKHLSIEDYEKRIKREVGKVGGFEVYRVNRNFEHHEKYDFHIRRK